MTKFLQKCKAHLRAHLMLLLVLCGTPAFAQINIKGKVSSPEGDALPGVTVLVEGTTTGTATDPDGNFALTVPGGNSVLIFSFIGFNALKAPIGNRTTFNVTLQTDVKALQEVVVIGYGTQDKRDVTGAITSVDAVKIQERQPITVFDALQGQASGVQINTDSRPGAGASIRIRGTSTIEGGENPLFVVDGVPMDNINGVNPSDIQSMEILKDAASAAIYGSRSANGVIIITTKRGIEGKPKLDVRYNYMLSQLAYKLPQATATDRRIFDRKRVAALNNPSFNTDSLNPSYNADNDLQAMLARTAIRHQLDFTVSGATPKLNYYTSLGYLNDEGIIINSWAKQIRARINIEYKATDKFTYGNRMQFSYMSENRISDGDVFGQAMQRPPNFRVFFPDGTYAPNIAGRKNPVAEALFRVNEYNNYQANIYNFLSYQIIKGLKITSDFNIRLTTGDRTSFAPKLLSNDGTQNNGGYYTNFDTYWMQQNYLNYDKKFGSDHTLNAVLGVSAEKWVEKDSQIEGNSYVTESVLTTNSIQDKLLTNIFNNETRHTLAGMFGRLSYSYKGKYIFNSNIRRDGSSRFGKENRWGIFPSASLGWRFSDESFMGWSQRYLQDGKLRVSYGATGNERIGNYDALERYSFGTNYYNGISGIVPVNVLSNPQLSWETQKQMNAGIDLSFLDNRISFTADYYIKNTEDLLYGQPLPGELGYLSTRVNVGTIQNKGFEFAINAFPVRNENLSWNVGYNMSFNRDKVLELSGGIPITPDGRWYLEEGGRLGNFYGWKNLGVFQYDQSNAFTPDGVQLTPVFDDQNKFAYYTLNGDTYTGTVKQQRMPGGISKGGDVIWQNTNGDDIIDDKDRVVLANAQPKFFAGLFNQVTYKSFSLSFNLYTQWGNTIYNKGRRDQSTFNGVNLTPDKYIIRDAWEKPGDITRVPKIPNASTMANMPELNSYFLEDGSFIRLRNVKLTYELNPAWASKVKLKGLSIYAYGNNLITWTNYLWYDPEISMGSPLRMGQDTGRYPRSRQVGAGLNLNF